MGRIRLIFSIAPPKGQSSTGSMGPSIFLAYVERLDIVPQAESLDSAHRTAGPDPVTNMLVLERPCRSDGKYLGDIVPLSQLHGPVQLTPLFGKKADNRLTAYNSLHFSRQYLLNTYSDKEIFWALTLGGSN